MLHTDAKAKWRVFYTAPRAEKVCEERMLERGLDVFLPKMTVSRQWKDRKKKVSEPLFQSYIFGCVTERERLETLQIKGIVRSIVFGGNLAEMTNEEIEQLKITQNDPERLGLLGHWLPEIGRQVLVEQGPMKGLKGEVLQHRGQSCVVIRLESLKQAVKVNMPIEWLTEFETV